jgi:hypothetical protein
MITLGKVPFPLGRVMIVPKGVGFVRGEIARSRNIELGVSHPDIKLIILEAPAPVFVTHSVHKLKIPRGDEQDSTNKRGVMITGVEVGRRHMKRATILGLSVGQLRIEGQKVNIVHGNVVEGAVHNLETNVDEAGAIEAKFVHLVQHKNLMSDALVSEKVVHVRHKLNEFIEAIAEWHENSQFWTVHLIGLSVWCVAGTVVD